MIAPRETQNSAVDRTDVERQVKTDSAVAHAGRAEEILREEVKESLPCIHQLEARCNLLIIQPLHGLDSENMLKIRLAFLGSRDQRI